MGSNKWQTVGTFKDLQVPENDKNIILSFHYYEPFLLTHYTAPWSRIKDLRIDFKYPGQMIDTTLYKTLDNDNLELVKEYNRTTGRDTLDNDIYQAVEIAHRYKLPLYCGEFGCYPSTDMSLRQLWYKDMMAVFDKYNIAWAHWNYKNDFPVVDAETLEPITDLTSILVK